jgi:hypothetical protein
MVLEVRERVNYMTPTNILVLVMGIGDPEGRHQPSPEQLRQAGKMAQLHWKPETKSFTSPMRIRWEISIIQASSLALLSVGVQVDRILSSLS